MVKRILTVLMIAASGSACEGGDPAAPAFEDAVPVLLSSAPVIVTVVPVVPFPGSGSGFSGTATLTRTIDGVSVVQSVTGLTVGNAYSIWWAVFDNPQGCDGPCDPSDLGRRQAQGTLVNGGGFVATSSSVLSSSELARHDVGGRQVWVGDASGVDNPYGAEFHVVLRDHGVAEANAGDLAQQISTFQNFCNLPPDPPGACRNVSAAVFADPHAPGLGA